MNISRKFSRGQGMTEYIIIVALIAVAAIGVFRLFGDTVRAQGGIIVGEIAGDASKAETIKGRKASGEQIDDASVNVGLDNFHKQNGTKTSE